MAERAQVPIFGNWESEEVPYTMYFDNARKEKKNVQIYQIDLQDNIDIKSNNQQKSSDSKMPNHEHHSSREQTEVIKSTHKPEIFVEPSKKRHNHAPYESDEKSEPEAQKVPEVSIRQRHERGLSREEGEMRRAFIDSPRRNSSNSPRHRHGGSSAGEMPKRVVARQSVGPDRSVDHSPHHPNSSHGRVGRRNSTGISSPSWEKKGTSEGLAPLTPGRSRLRSVTRGDDSPDRSPAVPKFGDWDETDPASAEGYTQVFNRVREEKHSETGKVPIMPTETSYSNSQKQYGNENAKGCSCFPWAKR